MIFFMVHMGHLQSLTLCSVVPLTEYYQPTASDHWKTHYCRFHQTGSGRDIYGRVLAIKAWHSDSFIGLYNEVLLEPV